jgi:sulfite oxidase
LWLLCAVHDQVKANWQAVPALQAMPVQSAFLRPKPGETLKPDATGCITAAGYAWSGGGNSIIRVEVSADAGKTWVSAKL